MLFCCRQMTFFNSREVFIYKVERSLTHDLYSSDFIQKTQLNAALSTSHFGKCSGSLAGPRLGEIVQKCLFTFSQLWSDPLQNCVVLTGEYVTQKGILGCFHYFWLWIKISIRLVFAKDELGVFPKQTLEKTSARISLIFCCWHFCRVNSKQEPS